MTAYVHTTIFARPAQIKFTNAWKAESDGVVCSAIELDRASITLHSLAEADALVAAAIKARAEWIRVDAGLPPVAPEPSAGCDGTHPDGAWLCNAVAAHEPLDHASYDPETGGVCARWPSVRAEGGGE